MRKNKGMTLITIVVTIIILIIVASVSILSGNKLVEEASDFRNEEVIQNVKQAVLRRKNEIDTQGSFTPIGITYIGKADPLVGKGDITANNWHLLDVEDLKELGVHDIVGKYIVNYKYEEILSMDDPDYTEKYLVCKYLHDVLDKTKELTVDQRNSEYEQYTTKKLSNKFSEDSDGAIYENKETGDIYGTKWYYITPEKIKEENILTEPEKNYISNSYLINFQDEKYVKVTDTFVER